MGQYLLYVKEAARGAKSYVTPCFEVDKQYWERENGQRLHVLGACPSLAFAFALRERINGELEGKRLTADVLRQLRLLAQSFAEEVTGLYVRAAQEEAPFGFSFWPAEEEALALSAEPQRDSSGLCGAALGGKRPALFGAPDVRPPACITPLSFNAGRVDGAGDGAERVGGGSDDSGTPAATGGWRERLLAALSGRALLWEEVEHLAGLRAVPPEELAAGLQRLVLEERAEWRPGVCLSVRRHWRQHRLQFVCERCGGCDVRLTACSSCRQGCAYCQACLHMGRSKCCTPFICVPGATGFGGVRLSAGNSACGDASSRLLAWSGRFSPWQRDAAERARRFAAGDGGQREFLIWAVCGAGKTELIFPAMEAALLRGHRVLLATPRKDVVNELVPRIRQAFPAVKVLGVHGSSAEKWEEGDVVVSTTHQVLRYYRRFPLVIVDEVDAFPFHNNPMLYRAVERAVAEGGRLLYLSATPPAELKRRLVGAGQKAWFRASPSFHSDGHVLVPRRYHGQPLPVPRVVTVPRLARKIRAGRAVPALLDAIVQSFNLNRRVFLFVPRVENVPVVLRYLQQHLGSCAGQMAGVHAADPRREHIVQSFREERLRLLVTTTILERGVTVPRSDVIVAGADAPVFDEAALVQIAGRVGRSADAPDGSVLFLTERRASAPAAAIRHIRQMNRLAGAFEPGGQAGTATNTVARGAKMHLPGIPGEPGGNRRG